MQNYAINPDHILAPSVTINLDWLPREGNDEKDDEIKTNAEVLGYAHAVLERHYNEAEMKQHQQIFEAARTKYRQTEDLNEARYSQKRVTESHAYMLEVQEFVDEKEEKDLHRGYMRALFRSAEKAAEYYDKHNPEMRPLNSHGTLCSDWDEKTELRYIVRVYHGEVMTILPFNPADDLIVEHGQRF